MVDINIEFTHFWKSNANVNTVLVVVRSLRCPYCFCHSVRNFLKFRSAVIAQKVLGFE